MKIKKKPESGASWMDTYGDMVTLLLCFFVLLYSISTVDQAKWVNFVKSMNPDAEEVSQVVTDQTLEPGDEEVPGSTDAEQKFEEIAENIQKEMDKLGVSADVEVSEHEGYHFISYKDKVFFDGDSSVLKAEGKKVLDGFARAVKPAASTVKEIRVLGHTSQETPDKQNDIDFDRTLSGDRATQMVIYLQKKDLLDPGKLVGESYGQFHPIASFDTAEGRAKNRRAEIIITEGGSTQKSLTDYYQEIEQQNSSKQ